MRCALSVLLTCLLPAAPVVALDCLAHDPAVAWDIATRSDDDYLVLRGTLDFDPTLLPQTDPTGMVEHPAPPPVPAIATGHLLTPDGFTRPVVEPVVIRSECAGPWCGQVPALETVVVFLRQTDSGLELVNSACNTWVFPDPDSAEAARVLACQAGSC